MSFELIPEFRIIFDESMVQAGIDFDQDDIFPWKDISGNIIAWSSVDNTGGWIYWNHLARFVYNRINHLVTAYAPPQAGHDFITQIYLENTLPFILSLRGFEVIHASAVLTTKGVVAFSALSGTGKSTIAYTLQTRGYTAWADDVVIFRSLQGVFVCEPIPFNLRLYPETIDEVNNFIPESNPKMDQNAPVQLEQKPLACVCLLERTNEEPTHDEVLIRKLPIQEAFTQLLPHAYNFELNNPTRSRQMMTAYINLVSAIPVYQLCYPKGMKALSKLIDQLETTIF